MNLKKLITEAVLIDQLEEIRTELSAIQDTITDHLDILAERNTQLELDKDIRKFVALKDKRTDDENAEELRTILNAHFDEMKSVENKFYKLMNSFLPKKGSSQQYDFRYQIKTIKSIIDKVITRKRKLLELSDLIRGAVLFKDKDEMREFIDDFRRKASNYITGYEYKDKGGDEFGYYGSHHFDLHIDGFDVELQVMPAKLWKYKEAAHDIYSKWRSKPEAAPKIDKELSKKLFRIGNTNEAFNIGTGPIIS